MENSDQRYHLQQIRKTQFAPIRFAMIYLIGTFFIFLLSNLAGDVSNMLTLSLFVFLSFFGLFSGYWLGISKFHQKSAQPINRHFGDSAYHRWLVIAGALYFAIWGINQFYEYGATDLQDILNTILSPGEAYKAKFAVYSEQLDTSRVNRVTQILIIFSIIYAIFIPILIASWQKLNSYLKLCAVISVFIYAASFLFIGTLKGLGDIILFLVTGIAVSLGREGISSARRINRKRAYFIIGATGLAFFTYMAVNQAQRAEQFGISESGIVGDISNTLLTRTIGSNAAFGVYVTLAYPSHGYRGLAYSLEQPFVFSRGAGLSQAYESYRLQFLGGEDNRYLTYPYRAEQATGWPAGMYWSTIFPWLASDLSFYGVPIFMVLIGFIFARLWTACIFGNDPFALAALGQMIIFIAFIPANNQVLMQRQGLWSVITLIVIWFARHLTNRQLAR